MRDNLLTTLRQALRVLNIEPRGIRHPWDGDQYKARSEARISVMEAIAALEKGHQFPKGGDVVSPVAGERSDVHRGVPAPHFIGHGIAPLAEAPRCGCGRKGPHDCSATPDFDGVSHV